MLSKYRTKDEFLAAVASVLKTDHGAKDVDTALLAGISQADSGLRDEAAESNSVAFNLRVGSWIIRDDDVPIFQAISATASAVVASAATTGLAWPAVSAALTAFAELCWRAWRKGARLSSLQVFVYGVLQAYGPLSLDELSRLTHVLGKPVSTDLLRMTVRSLAKVELNDGSIVALATEDNGDWRFLRI